MEWKGVSSREYEELFRCVREIIDKIEHDPRLKWEGSEMKQQLREVVRTVSNIEKKLCD